MPSNLLRDWAIQPDRNNHELVAELQREQAKQDLWRLGIWTIALVGFCLPWFYGVFSILKDLRIF